MVLKQRILKSESLKERTGKAAGSLEGPLARVCVCVCVCVCVRVRVRA